MFKIKFNCSILALIVSGIVALLAKQSSSQAVINSTQLLDSINKDIEEIKRTLNESIASRTAAAAAAASSSPYSSSLSELTGKSLSGHYLEDLEKDRPWTECSQPTDSDSLWKYSIPYLNESLGLLKFSDFKGKPLLLVNVATFCESTIEYPLYNQLKEKYGDNLIIIGFPSNQFWNQEPTGDAQEIYNAIKYVRPGNGFIPKFPLTKRIDVNGENQNPIYSYLKRSCPSTRTRFSVKEHYLLWKPKNSRDIRWNFEKFLIHPETGYPIRRYDQKYLPDRIVPDIDRLLLQTTKSQK